MFYIVTKSLDQDQQRKFSGAFDPKSTVIFTGKSLFDSRSGNVSDDFLDLLDNDEKKAIMDLQKDWKDGKCF